MNQIAIAKTLLTIWPGLEDYINMMVERARAHALCSYHTPDYTKCIMDKIIDLNVKQQTIRNLSDQLNYVIGKMPDKTQIVIRSYYRLYETATNIIALAKKLGIAERTFYRHLDRAVVFIAKNLTAIGINFFTWQDLLHQHRWIRETFMHQCQLNPLQTNLHQMELNH